MGNMTVAVLGTGKMGAAAARRLARQGFATTLWNRTRARAEAVGAGEVRDTPREAAGQAEVVISILTGPEAVRAVYAELEPSEAKVFLEMSTAGPDVHEELGKRFSTLVAAPVIAPPSRLEAGEALLRAGGDEAVAERARPVFEALGKVRYVGSYRRAGAMKLMNNTMLAVTIAAAAELVEAGVRTGLTPAESFEWMRNHAPYLDTRSSAYLGGPYEPLTFALRDIVKDVDLALRLLDGPDFPMPIVEAVRQAFAEVMDEHGDKELTAVLERYRR